MLLGEAMELVDALEEEDIEAEVRRDYSGRSMYGKSTVGVIVNSTYVLDTVLATAEKLSIPALRVDAMGKGSIFY